MPSANETPEKVNKVLNGGLFRILHPIDELSAECSDGCRFIDKNKDENAKKDRKTIIEPGLYHVKNPNNNDNDNDSNNDSDDWQVSVRHFNKEFAMT